MQLDRTTYNLPNNDIVESWSLKVFAMTGTATHWANNPIKPNAVL